MARTVKCPKCGAELKVEDDMQEYMFCPSDGTKIALENVHKEPERTADKQFELEKERIKAQKEVELKKLEVEVMKKRKEEHEKKRANMTLNIWLIGSLGLLFLYFLIEKIS